jgi:hypothetical protein
MRKRLAAGQGQALILVALALTAITGMVALAVDVGHVYERRQAMQNVATSAAEAGAYETLAINTVDNSIFTSEPDTAPLYQRESDEDALVYNRMLGIVKQYDSAIVSPAMYVPNDGCNDAANNFTSNRLYMRAAYLDQKNFFIYVDPSNNPVQVDPNDGHPIDSTGNPATDATPLLVGDHMYRAGSYSGASPAQNQQISGVKVVTLGGCVPRFFGGVLGHGDFRVASDAAAGQPEKPASSTPSATESETASATASETGTPTASVTASATASETASITDTPSDTPTGTLPPSATFTATPTNTNTATITLTPTNTNTATITLTPTNTNTATATPTPTAFTAGFMIWGTPQPSPNPNYPETLFAQGAPNAPTSTTNCPGGASSCTGDLVTIYSNSGNWVASQYGDQAAGLSGVPDGNTSISPKVHDASMDGCFTTTVPVALNVPLTADYNHGGVGHCTTWPKVGDIIPVPVVWEVHKNDGSCSANGGFCEFVEAIALVLITQAPPPASTPLQGYIVGIPTTCAVYGSSTPTNNCDPQHIIQLPGQPPLPGGGPATSTPTQTATPVTLVSVSVSPATIQGHNGNQGRTTGTVTLSGPAPAGGAVVTLSSSNSAAASVPANVTVAAGNTTANFTIQTSPVGSNTDVTISATYNSVISQVILHVTT